MMLNRTRWGALPILSVLFSIACIASEKESAASLSYSPDIEYAYPNNVYWGDTHLHTNLSVDASYWGGNKTLTPDDAYRFSRGDIVQATNGMNVQLSRPLDFLVIADHAYNMGVVPSLYGASSILLETEEGKQLLQDFQHYQDTNDQAVYKAIYGTLYGEKIFSKERSHSIWMDVVAKADAYNSPGKFTTFGGYEWTSWGSPQANGGNLHRVVIYKDGADKTNQITPLSSLDSSDPEDLWQSLEQYQQKTGGDVLAIPHNGNVSNGEMFPSVDFDGHPLSVAYAKTRNRWEPLYEVTQIKGDGETHPILSPTDEFANYETWNSWAGMTMQGVKTEGWIERKKYEYARSALKQGLEYQSSLGVNPFKFGMIGSTDSHTSLATADENNFWGKVSKSEPSPKRILEPVEWNPNIKNWETSASGYAAVWAEENTRESLFAAMKRKEVYATTGSRMTVRFFGGWDYNKNDAFRHDLARIGYTGGVPMGGDLTHAPKDKSPQFLIRAVKDPEGANLDRVQVIKGWRSSDGELHEKIYNVALSDNRKKNWRGNLKPVGSTVDVKEASYTNTIGDPELSVVWQDPDFNKDELAFYYVRVLEIPTPRWTAYDAKYFGIKNIPEDVPMITQERAYSSPIWYSPNPAGKTEKD